MSITVVTTRDYEGAPTTRDVYADAVRYHVDDSNLVIYSAEATLLAFYGSGNWQSVLVDDPAQVHRGPIDRSIYADMPVAPAPTTSQRRPGAGPASGYAQPAEVLPRVPSTVLQRPRPDAPSEVAPPPSTPTAPTPETVNASAEMLARSPSMRRVRFAPKVFRDARPGATPREPNTTWSRPASIRPVVFRPKRYKGAELPPEEPEADADPDPSEDA